MKIKIENTKGNKTEIDVLPTQTIGELKVKYCKLLNIDITTLQIKFDGTVLNKEYDNKSFDDLLIGDGDIIMSNDRSLGGKNIL